MSTVSTTGRRYLEWDYGRGPLGLQYHTQWEAAASLSQLEKMAITGYTKHLGEDEKRRSKESSHHHQMPPDFGDTGADLLGEKITKFTDSCISLLRGRVCSEARGRRLGSGEQRRGRAPEAGGHQSSHPRLALWPRRLVSSCRSWAALGAVVV